jgi:hypothetical protein
MESQTEVAGAPPTVVTGAGAPPTQVVSDTVVAGAEAQPMIFKFFQAGSSGNYAGNFDPTEDIKLDVYWKYVNPSSKDDKYIRSILRNQGYKLSEDKSIEGNSMDKPFLITDEIYATEKTKYEATEEKEKEEKERYEKEDQERKEAIKKRKEEKKVLDDIIKKSGSTYFNYIKTFREELEKKNKIEGREFRESNYVVRLYETLQQRYEALLDETTGKVNGIVDPNDNSVQYYVVSKRNFVNGKKQPCIEQDFSISKKEWDSIKYLFYDSDIIDVVDREYSCLNTFNQFTDKFSNKISNIFDKSKVEEGPVEPKKFFGLFGGKRTSKKSRKSRNQKKRVKSRRTKK